MSATLLAKPFTGRVQRFAAAPNSRVSRAARVAVRAAAEKDQVCIIVIRSARVFQCCLPFKTMDDGIVASETMFGCLGFARISSWIVYPMDMI